MAAGASTLKRHSSSWAASRQSSSSPTGIPIIEDARRDGARIAAGGGRPDHLPDGNLLAARVIADVTEPMRTPFGGAKASGIGPEGGDYAFDFYCDAEVVHVALGDHAIPKLGRLERAPGGESQPTWTCISLTQKI